MPIRPDGSSRRFAGLPQTAGVGLATVRVATALLLALVLAPAARAAVEYDVTSLGDQTLDAWAVNDDGVAVGTMDAGAPYNGYRWTPSAGLARLDGKDATPFDVNRAGVAAGLHAGPQDTGIFFTGAMWDVSGNLTPLTPAPIPTAPRIPTTTATAATRTGSATTGSRSARRPSTAAPVTRGLPLTGRRRASARG